MKPKYRDLNNCVEIYKSEGSNKDEAFQAILDHLTHHINSLCNVICETQYDVNKKVFKMMYRGLHACAPNMAWSSFGIEEDDLRQQIYMIILLLMQSYKYDKVSFLRFVTFLLPRRISAWVEGESKTATKQYYTRKIEDGTDDMDYVFKTKQEVPLEVPDRLSFLTDEEFQILADYIDGMTLEKIMGRYHMPTMEDTKQRIKELEFRTSTVLKSLENEK